MGKTAKLFDLTGKSVIVTGSGRGLGRAMARGLAEAGARVTICGRSADIVGEAAEELRADGHEALDVEFDARDRADVQRLIDTTVAAFGGLDIMVVNHGIGRAKRAENITPDGWNEMIGINLTSAFTCAQLAGQYMIERGRGGSIVLTGSTGSLVAFEGLASYGAAKAGLYHAARHLAAEWGRHDIRVNVVAPGYMTRNMRGSGDRYEDPEHLAGVVALTPLGRKGEPEELMGPVVFLASDAASYVTGHVIPVDGGWCIL